MEKEDLNALCRLQDHGGPMEYKPPTMEPIDPQKKPGAVLTRLAGLGYIKLTAELTDAGDDAIYAAIRRDATPE